MSDLAPMREQVYSDPRPKEYFDRFHERTRRSEPNWVYEAVRVMTSLYSYTFLRARAISVENVPESRRHRSGVANEEDADHDEALRSIGTLARSRSQERSLSLDNVVGRWQMGTCFMYQVLRCDYRSGMGENPHRRLSSRRCNHARDVMSHPELRPGAGVVAVGRRQASSCSCRWW